MCTADLHRKVSSANFSCLSTIKTFPRHFSFHLEVVSYDLRDSGKRKLTHGQLLNR
jgi:hypothetical protein